MYVTGERRTVHMCVATIREGEKESGGEKERERERERERIFLAIISSFPITCRCAGRIVTWMGI